jgi:glucokinase
MAKMSISRSIRAPPTRDLNSVRRFKTGDFPTFTDALQAIRVSCNSRPRACRSALPSPESRWRRRHPRNCRWYISVSGLKSFLANPPVLINDFSAIAWSLAGVDVGRLKRIGMLPPKATSPGRRFVVVGTGSGLGMATLIMGEGGIIHVVPGEGGHTSFAPQKRLRGRDACPAGGPASATSLSNVLLAASGLQNYLRRCRRGSGSEGTATHRRGDRRVRAPRRRAGHPGCGSLHFRLGSFAGNMVLCTGGFGRRLPGQPADRSHAAADRAQRFRAAFLNKGRMKKGVETVPVSFTRRQQCPPLWRGCCVTRPAVAAEREVRSAA